MDRRFLTVLGVSLVFALVVPRRVLPDDLGERGAAENLSKEPT